jgi:hypothetical protein
MSSRSAVRGEGVDLAILLPTLYAVRNVVYSGVLQGLSDMGLRALLLARECPPKGERAFEQFRSATGCRPMLRIAGTPASGRAFLQGVVASAFSRRHAIASHDLYRQWFSRRDGAGARRRSAAIELLGRLATPRGVLAALQREAERRYRASHDLEPFRRELSAIAPRRIWSTTCTSPLEYPYILAARDLRIPIVASILSFDNLSSRPGLPVFDDYLVWSEAMRAELLRLYPEVDPTRVSVTGTPQFDFHLRRGGWSRAETLERLGLPAGARFFLYAASHESLAPQEPGLVAGLLPRLAQDPLLKDSWIVLRLHPQDDGSRWEPLARSGRVVLSPACDAAPDAQGWKLPRPEEQDRLVASLRHADACLNIVSTMSLDAAILDRPVLGIEFSREPDAPAEIMYSEYDATHYRPIVESGGLVLARDWQELIGQMRRAVEDPGWGRAGRERMVERVCGFSDGGSTARVVSALVALLGIGEALPRPASLGA